MFPGQGAQYVGMGAGLYETEATFRTHLDECAELLRPALGLDLREVLYPSTASGAGESECARRLQQTSLAQPALFAVEYALARLWMQCGVRPAAMVGHSIGEYVAACLAGVFSLEDALALVAARGRLMQSLPSGTMLSVSLTERETQAYLDDQLSLAAVNGSSHCVVAGQTEAVEELERRLGAQGVDCRRLHTSHAFHSSMMEPILNVFAGEVRQVKLNAPLIPYVSNLTGKWATEELVTDPGYWVSHLRRTVRFADGVSTLAADSDGVFLEVGAGRTLSALARLQLDKAAGQIALASLRGANEKEPDGSHWLGALGQLWLAGVSVDWRGFYGDERRRRVHLPTYPFERRRYFIEPQRRAGESEAARFKSVKKTDVAEWFYVPMWEQTLIPIAADAEGSPAGESRWMLLCDDCGLGARMAERLAGEGRQVTVVGRGERFAKTGEQSYTLNPGQRDDYVALLADCRARQMLPHAIVHLWNVTSREPQSQGAESVRVSAFDSLLFLAQAIGEQGAAGDVRIGVVSNNVQDVLGTEELEPQKALLLGPSRVIAREYPNLSCSSIDILLPETEARREALVGQLIAELDTKNSERVVAYRGARRWAQKFEPVRLPEAAARPGRLRERGVYLITGGLGGVGLAVADYLARAARGRLILLGRTELPARETWDAWLDAHDADDATSVRIRKIRALEESGAEVLVVRADVSEREQMVAALAQATELFGEINGVVHAAGLAGGGLIQLQTAATARAVLAPKVEGTLVLEQLLQDAELDFCALFSSHVSLLGGLGRVEYAAANAFLDAFARRGRTGCGGYTVAINWDTWREAGMAANELARLKLDPEQSIPEGIFNREGADAFGRILEANLPQVVVSTRDFDWVVQQSAAQTAARELEELESTRRTQARHPRPQLNNSYVAPRNETEQRIADIWQDLLGIAEVGVEDNFFELGGDSVVSIQVIARANQAGLSLTPRQVFEHPTVGELAAVAGLGAAVQAEQGEVNGAVSLTPIQRWFFEQELAEPHHYNQSVMFEVRQELDPATLEKAAAHLLSHHDALRLRFTRDERCWQQFNAATGEDAPFTFEDLSALPQAEQGAAIGARADALQRSLNPAAGPLMRVALFRLGEGRPGRLLIVIHHLAVDGLSWRTLLEDLQAAYQQLQQGEAVSLPAKTTSFRQWARRLEEHAQTAELQTESAYWLGTLGAATARLPLDAHGGENTSASARSVSVSLTTEETLALLQEVPKAFHTQINDVLLTALAQSFAGWTGERRLLVDLEGHGREALFDDVDVSRTVGWFTTIFPVLLDLGAADSPGAELKRIKEGLRGVPQRGIGYGLLRYLSRDAEVTAKLAALPPPQVNFLYLGQLNQVVSGDSLFGAANESTGASHSPSARRSYLLEITGRIVGGQLNVEFTYSENLHDAATVERLAHSFAEALRSIIDHCRAEETVGYTPSDFAEFGWTQEDLDNILERINDSTGIA
jgi:non-ribosomal peptide synthase protein (TIGR01720 family)